MTPTEINIAIAEALPPCPLCGWKTSQYSCAHLPNYHGDLNAMHEAEKGLTETQQTEYMRQLHFNARSPGNYLLRDFDCAHATASQRAEAFLRTVGKWRGTR